MAPLFLAYFGGFSSVITLKYVGNLLKMSQIIENLSFFFRVQPKSYVNLFKLSFLRGQTSPPLVKTSKNCLHLPMENGVFHFETDGGEYSSFGTICLNEGIMEISKKNNESSSSFFVKLI